MKNRGKVLLVAAILIGSISANAQYFNKMGRWQKQRHEIAFLYGWGNYMGDLGGLDKPGTYWFLWDLEITEFQTSYGGQYRYNIDQMHAVNATFISGNVSGSDALTGYSNRNNRNVTFKSKVIEFSVAYEFHFLRPEPSHIYKIKGAQGLSGNSFDAYAYLGVGGFYFNPQGMANGSGWTDLQPLGTEGQGLPGGPSAYSLFNFSVPMGIAFQYQLNRHFKIGIDYGYRFTGTDYLDDVSTIYYDNDVIRAQKGDVAALFANPTNNSGGDPSWTTTGAIRGNPANRDAYMFAMFSLTKVIHTASKRGIYGQTRRGRKSQSYKRRNKRLIF